MKLSLRLLAVAVATLVASGASADDVPFGAWYTRVSAGEEWEASSRTGGDADVVVSVGQAGGRLVFWRGNSYLPYWKTAKGQWDLPELVARSGDGTKRMPDRVNVYSHVMVIRNDPASVTVRWRYLPEFAPGNPHGKVDPTRFVEELFTIRPDGEVERTLRAGTAKVDDWNDPLNRMTQRLRLSADGVAETGRQSPRHSPPPPRVAGNPQKGPAPLVPALCCKFDEGEGDETKEEASKASLAVGGQKTLWKKGVSGTALQFDGYHSVVAVPAAKAPEVTGGDLTLEAWFALGAYPWNWAPVVQQGDDDGYFLGIDSHGYPGFMVKVDGVWQQLTIPAKPPYTDTNHLSLFRWYHLIGTYDKGQGMMRLFVDGKEVASKAVGKGGVQALASADLRIGKAGVLRAPTEGTHDTLPSEFGLDGLIDEVKVHTVAMDATQVAAAFGACHPGPEIIAAPDMQKRALPACPAGGKFGASHTHLPYYETWDNLWRAGDFSDVVVGFDRLPVKFVFWRGVSYIPMIVNESNQWFTHEFNETGFTAAAPGDCEPMSDKGCWDSHVRVIEDGGARVVVHWRYRLINPDHHWANYDANGWGDIADWHYYIYPDGVASKIMRCYSSRPDSWFEWDEQIAVLGEGQHPESVVNKTPVMTLVDNSGKATTYDWNPTPPKPDYKGQIIQMIHFTGKYHPFAIQGFQGGDIYGGERTWYSVFPSWNHWPTSQVNSSGRNASFPDRAAHSSISHLNLPMHSRQAGTVAYQEKILMEGMTDQPAASLTRLAKSWLNAPPVSGVTGGTSQGYLQARRAYGFRRETSSLRFRVEASEEKPIHNLCFEVRNWNSRKGDATLKVNGAAQVPGPDFRQSVTIDEDGSLTLVVWLGISATTPQDMEINTP